MGHFGNSLIESYPGLLEEEKWIDGEGRTILIEDMSYKHKANVLKYLKRDLHNYPLRHYFEDGEVYHNTLDISEKQFNELKEIYELLVRKIYELENL